MKLLFEKIIQENIYKDKLLKKDQKLFLQFDCNIALNYFVTYNEKFYVFVVLK